MRVYSKSKTVAISSNDIFMQYFLGIREMLRDICTVASDFKFDIQLLLEE